MNCVCASVNTSVCVNMVNLTRVCVCVLQVRNLCYMVTRREKMKSSLFDVQEKIFHLQIQLLEEDLAGGERHTHTCIHTHTHTRVH